MIDPQSEEIVSLADAAKRLPSRPNVATLWRWRTTGIRGITLETMLFGGRRVTSLEALDRFFARVTAAADGQPIPTRTPRQRKSQQRAARRKLQAAGLLDP